MAKMCGICGEKLGFRKFHCLDGVICKKCYQIVSNSFTSTIAKKTMEELMQTYAQNAAPINLGEDGFQVTRKIGTVMLLDDNKRKLCIPSNRNVTKQYARPEVFRYEDLTGFRLCSEPAMKPEKLAELARDKTNAAVIQKMMIELRIKDGSTRQLIVIPSAVRTSSYAFRKSYEIAMNVMGELDDILC